MQQNGVLPCFLELQNEDYICRPLLAVSLILFQEQCRHFIVDRLDIERIRGMLDLLACRIFDPNR